MRRGLLAVRADATRSSGTGHVSRALALAEAWKRAGGDTVLLAHQLEGRVARRVDRAGVATVRLVADLPADLSMVARELGAEWIALDGYPFGPEYQDACVAAGFNVLAVDDHGTASRYEAPLVVDPNVGARSQDYADRSLRTVALLGARYALIRQGFTGSDGGGPPSQSPPRVLVTVGGFGDDLESEIAAALETVAKHAVEVVTAGGSVDDMAPLMRSCSLAVAAAGGTTWELCALGVPMVLLTTAPNQVPVAERVAALGAAINLGVAPAVDAADIAQVVLDLLGHPDRLHAMSVAARQITDGRGADRVVEAMGAVDMQLRPATRDDARLLFEWANDPTTRNASLSPAPIPWEDHVRWLNERLATPTTSIFLGELRGEAIGQIRFERTDGELEVGISIAAPWRGRLLASRLLADGTARVLHTSNVRSVRAVVKEDNIASISTFEAAGYEPAGAETRAGLEVLTFVRSRRDSTVG